MVHQIWGYILPIKTQLKTALHKSQNTSPTKNPTNRGLGTTTMKGPVPVLCGEGWIPLVFMEKVGLRAEPIGRAILNTFSLSPRPLLRS